MKKIIIALLLVCCAIAATGCTSLIGSTGTSSASQRYYGESDNSVYGLAVSEKAAYAPMPTVVPTYAGGSAPGIETRIIKTAQVSLEVTDVTASADALRTLAQQNGGYISSSNVQRGYNDRLSATVVLRIPQAAFDTVIESVKASGTVKSVSVQGEDVTEQYIDLTAQKTSYQNQLAQYNTIMKQAVKVEDVIAVQAQIDRVQTELDRLEGRLRYLNSRIDLSTVTVSLQEPEPVGGDTGHSFITAINEGIAGFFGMIDALIILLFTLLPLAIIGGIVYAVWCWRKGKAGKPPAAAPAESGEAK